MFRWCSFCQRFLGEAEPRGNYSITHGICLSCKPSLIEGTANSPADLKPVSDFFQYLMLAVNSGTNLNTSEVLKKAIALKIKPVDLLAGVLQPLLYEIGEKYEKGEVSIAQEHQFSHFVDNLISQILAGYGITPSLDQKEHDVLLVTADGNYHYLGIRFIEVLLRQEGISVYSIFPSMPTKEIYKISKIIKPKVIGISVSLKDQYEDLVDELEVFKESNTIPMIVIGGQGITDKILPSFASVYNKDLDTLLAEIRNFILQK